MTDLPAQAPPLADAAHLVLYDGVCGLCNRLVQFLLTHDCRGVFVLTSLQSATGRAVVEGLGGDPTDLTSFYVVVNYQTHHRRVVARSNAALFIASQLGWPWKAAGVARVLPRAVRDRAYKIIVRNRYRVFGRLEQCLPSPPEFRGRFVE